MFERLGGPLSLSLPQPPPPPLLPLSPRLSEDADLPTLAAGGAVLLVPFAPLRCGGTYGIAQALERDHSRLTLQKDVAGFLIGPLTYARTNTQLKAQKAAWSCQRRQSSKVECYDNWALLFGANKL